MFTLIVSGRQFTITAADAARTINRQPNLETPQRIAYHCGRLELTYPTFTLLAPAMMRRDDALDALRTHGAYV